MVREGFSEALLASFVQRVADDLGLPPDWLNNAVGMFTPPVEPDDLFALAGTYPAGDNPGLRVLVTRPHDLLAMKLKALASLDRGNKDMVDARALSAELGIATTDELRAPYRSIHGEEAGDAVLRQFPSVLPKSRS